MNQSLKMPRKGESARMLAELQAEHASEAPPAEGAELESATPVTTLQVTSEGTHADAPDTTNVPTPVSPLVVTHAEPVEPTADTHEHASAPPSPTRRTDPTIRGPEGSPSASPPRRRKDEREDRFSFAMSRGSADEVAVVTVRVSAALNRYMDDYTARVNRLDPKRKYRKQDAVLEAFAAFYADHPMPAAPEEGEL